MGILLNIKILFILILLIGLGLGVYLVQKSGYQIFKPKAKETMDITSLDRNLYSEKGMQIDTSEETKIPSTDLYDKLDSEWVRFSYRPNQGIPASIPSQVKTLLIFNNESVSYAPLGSLDNQAWKRYIDGYYLSALDRLLSRYPNVDAIEIWNEEDTCPAEESFCPGVPAQSYAYMLKTASEKIKNMNAHIQVVMGGLVSGDKNYIYKMKEYEPEVFEKVDAVGLHPYGTSPNGWCAFDAPECGGRLLSNGDLAEVINEYKKAADNLPVWVTEIGYGTNDEVWQAEFLIRSFKVLSDINIPVVIWYAWTDRMLGGSGANWGLVNSDDVIKAAGSEFQLFD